MPLQHINIKHKFLTKLLLSHILLAAIPIVLTGVVLIRTAQKTLEQTYKDRTIELARHSADNIDLALENAKKILKFNASNILKIRNNRLAQELSINEMTNDFPIFRDIKILDDSGRIVISTSFIEDSGKYVDEDFLKQVLSADDYPSEVFISADKLPVKTIAEPILLYEEVVGTLLAEVNLKEMWDLIENSVVGKKAQAFVFDKNGRYLAHSERKKVYLGERFQEAEILRNVALNQDDQRIYVNRQGIEIVAAYVSIPRLGWGVVIQQPKKEAFAVANKMKIQIVWFVAISVLLSSLIAFLYTRWIITPVNQLVSGIDKFSAGDLQYRIPKLGRDEISALAEQFNDMAEKLTVFQDKLKKSERSEILSKLASVLSHEIKNPLNAMVINMQIMEREFNKPAPRVDKLRHYLEIVSGEIKRVDNLVNDFLSLARPPKLERKRILINQLLDELIIHQQADALHSGVRVQRQYKFKDIDLLIDETKIRQVFLNIFLNATQAMPGGGNLTIELEHINSNRNEQQSQWVVARFRDTGKGIKKEQLNRIFDFYYSTRANGTGLGLSIAQQIIEEHGGRIEVESKIGEGSLISVFLPKS